MVNKLGDFISIDAKVPEISADTGSILLSVRFYVTTWTDSSFRPEALMNQGLWLSATLLVLSGRVFWPFVTNTSESYRFVDLEKRRYHYIKMKEWDKKFDDGENLLKHLDLTKAKRPGQDQKRVNVDFPIWMIQRLDKEARRLGVPRQSLIKIWIAEKLEQHSNP